MNRSIAAAAPIAAPDRDLPANIRSLSAVCCKATDYSPCSITS